MKVLETRRIFLRFFRIKKKKLESDLNKKPQMEMILEMDELPIEVLLLIFSGHFGYSELIQLCLVCKRFHNIISQSNLWKFCCIDKIGSSPDMEISHLLYDLKKDWKWAASALCTQIPTKSDSTKIKKSLKGKVVALYKKPESAPSVQKIPSEDALTKLVIYPLATDAKSRLLMRLMWRDKDVSTKILVTLVAAIERAKVLEIQSYFEVITKILDYVWPQQKTNIEVFMKEILNMFSRKRVRHEVMEWRECARKLQKLADHSLQLRKWLINNRKKWQWLPQYYTQTRMVVHGAA